MKQEEIEEMEYNSGLAVEEVLMDDIREDAETLARLLNENGGRHLAIFTRDNGEWMDYCDIPCTPMRSPRNFAVVTVKSQSTIEFAGTQNRKMMQAFDEGYKNFEVRSICEVFLDGSYEEFCSIHKEDGQCCLAVVED